MRDLVLILDAMDEGLLAHVHAGDGLRVETARRMMEETVGLLTGATTLAALDVWWPEWVSLVRAFADAYELDELDDMFRASAVGESDVVALGPADREYLTSLAGWLALYVQRWAAGAEF